MGSSRSAGRELLALRLTAQLLSGTPATDVVEVTRHLLAVQAQDPRGDECEREPPCSIYPWDGVRNVRPYRKFQTTVVEGVY